MSADNPITCEKSFVHLEGDEEVRACGFKNGGMAIYSSHDMAEGTQIATKYFFPAETARVSSTLDPYNAVRE